MKTSIVFLLSFLAFCLFFKLSNAQDNWTKKADFPGVGRSYAAAFCIGNKAYVGCGDTSDDFTSGLPIKSDFWEYDPATNTWTQKASIPGYPRLGAVCFSIGNKGFIGCGNGRNDFWEYDPSNNIWKRKADVPGDSRLYPASFSIGGKGYTGMGFVWGVGNVLNDFWEYDTLNNKWSKKANFGGVPKCYPASFSIGNKGYVGTGEDSSFNLGSYQSYHDFWEYDPQRDKWTQKASLGYSGRERCIGFSLANKGYIGFGLIDSNNIDNDMWAYDTAANQWKQMAYCDANYLPLAPFAFSFGNKAYVGSGETNTGFSNDLWQYTDHTSGIDLQDKSLSFTVYPNPSSGNFVLSSPTPIESYEICGIDGKVIFKDMDHSFGNYINVDASLPNGLYLIRVISKMGSAVKKIEVTNN